jgi:hypothetical protein
MPKNNHQSTSTADQATASNQQSTSAMFTFENREKDRNNFDTQIRTNICQFKKDVEQDNPSIYKQLQSQIDLAKENRDLRFYHLYDLLCYVKKQNEKLGKGVFKFKENMRKTHEETIQKILVETTNMLRNPDGYCESRICCFKDGSEYDYDSDLANLAIKISGILCELVKNDLENYKDLIVLLNIVTQSLSLQSFVRNKNPKFPHKYSVDIKKVEVLDRTMEGETQLVSFFEKFNIEIRRKGSLSCNPAQQKTDVDKKSHLKQATFFLMRKMLVQQLVCQSFLNQIKQFLRKVLLKEITMKAAYLFSLYFTSYRDSCNLYKG